MSRLRSVSDFLRPSILGLGLAALLASACAVESGYEDYSEGSTTPNEDTTPKVDGSGGQSNADTGGAAATTGGSSGSGSGGASGGTSSGTGGSVAGTGGSSGGSVPAGAIGKPRVIAITDMTHDDDNTLIRLLHFANEVDIEAIIVTNQLPDFDAYSNVPWNRTQEVINAYSQVEGQLRKHDAAFPTAQALRNVTKRGHGSLAICFVNASENCSQWLGDGNNPAGLAKDSEGSNFLQQVFAKDDPRPIFVGLWGGPVTFAQALLRYSQKHSSSEYAALESKLHVYGIHLQDITSDFLLDLNAAKNQSCYDGRTSSCGYPRARPATMLYDKWHFWDYIKAMSPSEVQGHGALSQLYDSGGEGDTPAILMVLSGIRGLNDPRIPWHGSWGNMFKKESSSALPDVYSTCSVDKNELTRWMPEAKKSFLARLDWAIKAPGQVNRHPIAAINGDVGNGIVYMKIEPGQSVTLDASASVDPDGHALSYKFWHYTQASPYSGSVSISGASSSRATVTLPADAGDRDVHIILEVRDNGSPDLVGYRRVVIGRNARDPFGG